MERVKKGGREKPRETRAEADQTASVGVVISRYPFSLVLKMEIGLILTPPSSTGIVSVSATPQLHQN